MGAIHKYAEKSTDAEINPYTVPSNNSGTQSHTNTMTSASNFDMVGWIKIDKKGKYDILAVFAVPVDENDTKSFKYYEFVNSYDPQHFTDFVKRCKELSFYDTDITAKYGDKFLTLSTCEYTYNNGRLVVVAKTCKWFIIDKVECVWYNFSNTNRNSGG